MDVCMIDLGDGNLLWCRWWFCVVVLVGFF